MKQPKLIALDCDEVLLDYNEAWAEIYSKFFKTDNLKPKNTKAYYSADYWGVDWNNRKDDQVAFLKYFHDNGWKDMNPLEGSIEATHMLKEAGYKIFVITRMPEVCEKDRIENLQNLGFAFDAVIGAGIATDKNHNPKQQYIEALRPDYFVDDLMANFKHIKTSTKFVWLDHKKEHPENDELLKKIKLHSTHDNLLNFVKTIVN